MTDGSMGQPPRWAERLLRVFLPSRDRDTIAGDLLEEYREVVLPSRGTWRAQLWYVKQVLSFVDAVTLGLIIGGLAAIANLIATPLLPDTEDTPAALLAFYGPVFLMWALFGFATYRRSRSLAHAIKAGALIGFVTFAIFQVGNLVRINVFLDTVSHRDDWRNMLSNYRASGFGSFRTYTNYIYAVMTPLLLLIGSTIGAATGLVGGLLGLTTRIARHARAR
jgi:uncharacterized membrane protein